MSIFGGFGGMGEAGTEAVLQRYQLAAGAFRQSGAEVDFDYLVKDVRGRLAYTVAIESAEVLYANQTELQPHLLRVTMIFRFEKGEWRIVHRHADTMTELELPVALTMSPAGLALRPPRPHGLPGGRTDPGSAVLRLRG